MQDEHILSSMHIAYVLIEDMHVITHSFATRIMDTHKCVKLRYIIKIYYTSIAHQIKNPLRRTIELIHIIYIDIYFIVNLEIISLNI